MTVDEALTQHASAVGVEALSDKEKVHAVITQLLKHLPDSIHDDKTWSWCWNELSDGAQEAVKSIRKLAVGLLREGC